LVEVVVGASNYEVPFDDQMHTDEYVALRSNRKQQGAVIVFTLGLSEHLAGNDTAIRTRLSASSSDSVDRALVVPGSLRILPTPAHRRLPGRFGQGVAIARSAFTDESIDSTPILIVGAPRMQSYDPNEGGSEVSFGAVYVFEMPTTARWRRYDHSGRTDFNATSGIFSGKIAEKLRSRNELQNGGGSGRLRVQFLSSLSRGGGALRRTAGVGAIGLLGSNFRQDLQSLASNSM